MKKQTAIRIITAAALAVVVLVAAQAPARAFGHYFPGALGMGAATLPPQGFHYTIYNFYYNADKQMDSGGDELNNGLDLNVFASAHQFTYITDFKILGANFGFDAIVPLVSTDIEIKSAGIDESKFGIGDLYFEPFVLAWHLPRWDFAFALGFYAPTAESGNPSSAGFGYWSFMETLGATYYFDDARTWSASVNTRWLQNTENRDTEITKGAEVVAEWGLGKTLPVAQNLLMQLGVSGYTYLQLTASTGDGADEDARSRSNAVGPEIHFTWLKPYVLQASLRYLFEYGAEDASQGQNVCLTLIASF